MPMKKRGFAPKAIFGFVIILILFLSGCGGKKAKGLRTVEGDPAVIYKQGLVLFNKGKYKDALEKFEQLKSNFPDSPPFTTWAELKVADCHFFMKAYVEAVTTYEEFKKIHPTYEEGTYVQFQIGMSYFNQMTTADRDQTFTLKALSSFEYLVANSPPNLFAEKAKEKIWDCQRQLAGHEFHVGDFYYRHEKYQAAAHRFEGLLATYPKWLDQDKTLLSLGRCYIQMNQREKARETLTRLIKEYPKSQPAREAKTILAKDLTEKGVSRKGKAIAVKKTRDATEPDPEGLVLVKYEEEGKKAVPLKEEKTPVIKREGEKISFLPVIGGEAKPNPSRDEVNQSDPPPVPLPTILSSVMEEVAKPIPPRGGSEEVRPHPSSPVEEEKAIPIPPVPSEELKIALIPAEESPKSLPPAKNEPPKPSLPGILGPLMEEEKAMPIPPVPSEEPKIALIPAGEPPKGLPPAKNEPSKPSLPGILGPFMEKEKPKKEAPAGPLQMASLTDTAHPIDITSDSVETYTKENLILFKGNVMARQKDIVIYADSLEAMVIDNGKGIEKVVADGNVKIQQGLRVANCQKAIFYNLDKRVVLTGDPKVWEGDNIVSGEEIVFDIEQNRIEVKGGTKGRGKVIVYPKEATEKKE
jgi:outer membrane protein assembly factor BamD